ncbi:hypothetical protein [Nocardia sp. CY41]|uniref:hypothetical protein n=1 Tax=Nocardia sp. CY41 TaxID=2608686 RepID=UPI00135CDD11|nr:hypothetical protein [Nocardia sp. CY41]
MSGWTGRVAVWAALALMGLSSVGSFLFGSELAELAGMPLYLTGLWPIVVAATVFQAGLFYALLASTRDRAGSARYFAGQLVVWVVVAVAGNTLILTQDVQRLSATASVVVTSVPMLCLLICVYNTVIFLRARRPRRSDSAPAVRTPE